MLNIMVFVDIYIYIYPCCTWIANIAWGKKNTYPWSPWENHHEISTQSVVHIETHRDLEFSSLNPLHHSTRWYQREFHQNLHSFPPEKSTKITQKSPRKSPPSQEIKGGGRQAFRAEVWALQQLQEGWDGMGIPSGYVKHSCWTWWFIVDLSI